MKLNRTRIVTEEWRVQVALGLYLFVGMVLGFMVGILVYT